MKKKTLSTTDEHILRAYPSLDERNPPQDNVLAEWAQRAEAFGIVGIITEIVNPLTGEVHFCELLVNGPPRFLAPTRGEPDDDAV